MRAIALSVVVVLVAATAPTSAAVLGLLPADERAPPGVLATARAATADSFLVSFAPGTFAAVEAVVEAAGGSVLKSHRASGILVAEGPGVQFLHALRESPLVQSAGPNGAVVASGAEWNGAEWNGVEWNGAEWNGAEWNGAEWNGAEWNGGDPQGDPGTGFQWGLDRVDVRRAWNVTTGARAATLCVVDSGVDVAHRDVAPNLWRAEDGSHGWNAIDGSTNVSDDGRHGTHVATIAAGAVANAHGVSGVGNVRIMTVKALGADGTGAEGDVALGIAWCADRGADVVLLALSATSPSGVFDRAIRYATDRNVVLVASAGNGGGKAGVAYPASNPRVVAVAAIDESGARAPFSATGDRVALAAPGVDIVGAVPGGFASASGTSQAAAFVAGAAALYRDAHPGASRVDVRNALTGSAKDLGAPGRDAEFGHGLLDVGAALANGGA